jgi:ABC-type dipeptide/oligopeptide/nickel transport system permease subunit
MKITAQMSAILSLVLGLVFLGTGINGLLHVGAMADDATRADAQGFAWFWLFLAAVALGTSVLSVLMAKGKLGRLDS